MHNIPVLTFHTINNHSDNRPWSFLSVSVDVFENTLKYLSKHNYLTITLKELYLLKKNRVYDNKKRILIHFDDGFLDNYTIAYPMLKKYGMCATVFISPDFVDPRPIKRELQYDKIKCGDVIGTEDSWGYMSWQELQEIDKSGVIDVQAHAMSHTWYPCSDELVNYHQPNDTFYWLGWNINTAKKPYWLTQYQETDVPYGFPVFKYAKSLSGKKFIPDDNVIEYCISFYQEHKDLSAEAYISELKASLNDNFGSYLGRYESDVEFKNRVVYELATSKTIDEEHLNKKIEFLAWPGGAVNDLAKQVAWETGYLACTKKGKPYNEITDDIRDIYRVGGWSGLRYHYNPILFFEKLFIRMQLHRSLGNKSLLNRLYTRMGNIYRKRNISGSREKGEMW